MARENLSSAAKARAGSKLSGARKKAAQNVASKIAGTSSGKATTDAISKPASVAATAANTSISTNGSIAVVVPGLPTHITPDAISGMLPQFNESAYQITDPLNIPNMLVNVSCPDVESSQKDADYPLEIFLKYGNTTAAVKSFSDADEDWKYRKRDTNYAQNFFQLWVWDELDNTLNNADDPKGVGEKFKNFLKQAHHTGVGWIVSGQSVMTKQIPGFMDDDRELFTQIIIGTSKIRKYLEKYGKKILSAKVVTQLLSNLDDLEPYIEDKNSLVTDAARLLRLALVLDDKSPNLYFLPNLDSAKFDAEKIEAVITNSNQNKRQFLAKTSGKNGSELVNEAQNPYTESAGKMETDPPFPTIGGCDHSSQSHQIPHCPHCGGSDLKAIESGKRYQCKECTKRFVTNKVVWK
jgi:hypothetical protein